MYNTSMDKQQMQATIIEQLRNLEDVAVSELGVPVPEYVIRFDLKGRTAGWAIPNEDGTFIMRFNLDIAMNNVDEYHNTVIHEFAHIMTYVKFPKAKKHHGRHWVYVMQKLGVINPKRCHSYKGVVQVRKTRKFKAVCSCNLTHIVGIVSYKRSIEYKQEKGRELYRCSKCYSGLVFTEAIL